MPKRDDVRDQNLRSSHKDTGDGREEILEDLRKFTRPRLYRIDATLFAKAQRRVYSA